MTIFKIRKTTNSYRQTKKKAFLAARSGVNCALTETELLLERYFPLLILSAQNGGYKNRTLGINVRFFFDGDLSTRIIRQQ